MTWTWRPIRGAYLFVLAAIAWSYAGALGAVLVLLAAVDVTLRRKDS